FLRPDSGVRFGSGTENDPYVIKNWIISASNGNGIHIGNTTAYFIIRNCWIENGKDLGYEGIWLDNVRNGRVENCVVKNNRIALWIVSSSNIVAGNNQFENTSQWEISCTGSNSIRIYSSNVQTEDSVDGGILIQDSYDVRIENSIIEANSKSGSIVLQASQGQAENLVVQNCRVGPLDERGCRPIKGNFSKFRVDSCFF
ncbi:MAG: right-handed parallel beta-helix repeat-containing protein, partial [Candidatus Hadarchaeales archaeon]